MSNLDILVGQCDRITRMLANTRTHNAADARDLQKARNCLREVRSQRRVPGVRVWAAVGYGGRGCPHPYGQEFDCEGARAFTRHFPPWRRRKTGARANLHGCGLTLLGLSTRAGALAAGGMAEYCAEIIVHKK